MMSSDIHLSHEALAAVRQLSAIDHKRTVLKFALISGATAAAYTLVALGVVHQFGLLYFAAFMMTSWAQNAILEELHDASHYRLARDRHLNELLGGMYGSLIGISLVNFRTRHGLHHRHFGTARDPDLPQYQTCPIGRRAWLAYFLINFTGYGAIKSLLSSQSTLTTGQPSWQHPGFTLVMQVTLLVIGVAFNLPVFYFAFWLAPLFTLTYGISHLRTLLEHFNVERWQDPETGELCYGAFYNFETGIQRHLFGAQFGYNFHGTHHAAPSVPNYHLMQLSLEDYRPIPDTIIHTTNYIARMREILSLSAAEAGVKTATKPL